MCEVVACLILIFSYGPDEAVSVKEYPEMFVRGAEKVRYWETYGTPDWLRWREKSKTGDYCEMQINRRWHEHRLTRRGMSWYAIYNPEICWDVAFEIWKESGGSFRQWSTRKLAGVN